LDNLTVRIRDDLSKEGLKHFYYKAEDVIVVGGIPAITETRTILEGIWQDYFTHKPFKTRDLR